GPLVGVQAGEEVPIEPRMMAEISLVTAANRAPLQLADGLTATIEMDLPADLPPRGVDGAANPPTIPAWSLDLESAQWQEEGVGVVNGSHWTFETRHFSWWNADIPWKGWECVDVHVEDLWDENVPNAVVTAEGTNYTGAWSALTDSEGNACVMIQLGGEAKVYVGLPGNELSMPDMVEGMGFPNKCGDDDCIYSPLTLNQECEPGDEVACYDGDPQQLGSGVCKAGVQKCINGYWSGCQGQVLPTDFENTPELCSNGLDDDCNGVIDVGPTCELCDASQSCYTGLPITKNQGACMAGVVDCGDADICLGEQPIPDVEACNDEDCDGHPDCGKELSANILAAGAADSPPRILGLAATGNDYFVAGDFPSTIDFDGDTYTAGGNPDSFLARLSQNGALVTSRHISSTSNARVRDITVIGDDLLVAGWFNGAVTLGGDCGQLTSNGVDGFVARYNNALECVDVLPVTGGGKQIVESIAADENGIVIAGRYTQGLTLAELELPAGPKVFVAHIDPGLEPRVNPPPVAFGATNVEFGTNEGPERDLELELSDERVVLVGNYRSENDVAIGNGVWSANYPYWSGFALALERESDDILWSLPIGYSAHAHSLGYSAVDDSFVVTGHFYGSIITQDCVVMPTVDDNYEPSLGEDLYVLKLDGQSGSCIWGAAYGGPLHDIGEAIAVDSTLEGAGDIVVLGTFNSLSGFAFQPPYGYKNDLYPPLASSQQVGDDYGLKDLFLMRLDRDGHMIWRKAYGDSSKQDARELAVVEPTGAIALAGDVEGEFYFGDSPISVGPGWRALMFATTSR
ncbi:MAG: hypothetical protein ACPG4T_14200, partial [Nannocystaceae bacterium]